MASHPMIPVPLQPTHPRQHSPDQDAVCPFTLMGSSLFKQQCFFAAFPLVAALYSAIWTLSAVVTLCKVTGAPGSLLQEGNWKKQQW